jgi:hypothetical protein
VVLDRASPASSAGPSWLAGALGLVAVWLPFGVALSRAASAAQWRDDLPAVRDLGLVAVGFGGGLSTVVTQALALVPLGPRTFRAALGSVIALAIAARFLYGVVRRALAVGSSAHHPSPRLGAALAAIATLTAALSPTWQREATVGGGAMIATALVLAAMALVLRLVDRPHDDAHRPVLGLGVLAGAALAESPPAALAIVAMTVTLFVTTAIAQRATRVTLPAPRLLVLAVLFAVGIAALLSAPLALRPFAPRTWVDIGRTLSASSLSALDTAGARTTALAAWLREVGFVSLCIAGFGALVALRSSRLRAPVAPFLALVALDTLLPARAAGVLSADPLTALRSLAIAGIALASAVGVYEVTARILRARFPLARATAVLVVVFHLTLVALTSEEAQFATDRSEQFAAEVWGDEALAMLPPRSAVLVRSPAMAWRLWAARLTRGERPDVVVIPIPLLDRGRVATSLVATERALEPLLTDFALTGQPSEFALSHLADVRPLHVEFDPAWSRRLVSHLRLDGLWLEFAPQPLGPSDRRQSSTAAVTPMKRLLSAITAATVPESPTAAVVASTLRADANVLNALGERDAADLVLARLHELASRDPSVEALRLPYALKGMRRALLKREPVRAR